MSDFTREDYSLISSALFHYYLLLLGLDWLDSDVIVERCHRCYSLYQIFEQFFHSCQVEGLKPETKDS